MLKRVETTLSEPSRNFWIDCLVFVLLVALGGVGRHWLIELPNFTPMAAVGIFAGFYFRRVTVALLVPLAAMAIANVWLPIYGSLLIATVCYTAFFLPVLLPRLLRRAPRMAQAAAYGLLPAIAFYATSNFAEWAAGSMYKRNFAGLIECYTVAIPFFRNNIAGDIFYLALVFGTYAIVQAASVRQARRAYAVVRS